VSFFTEDVLMVRLVQLIGKSLGLNHFTPLKLSCSFSLVRNSDFITINRI